MNFKRKLYFLSLFVTLAVTGYAWHYFDQIVEQLPPEYLSLRKLTESPLELASEVFDKDGNKVGEFLGEKRYFVAIDHLPRHLIDAFLSAEDKGFYEHFGLNPMAILRAFVTNVTKGRMAQGASTITQQLARLYFLGPEKHLARKVKEAILALFIESRLSKHQILELYLNKIYLGSGAYGVEAASRVYFNKPASAVNLSEASLLAGLPKAPSRLALNRNLKASKERQKFVLGQMLKNGLIDKDEAKKAFRLPVEIHKRDGENRNVAPYFLAEVKRELARKLGLNQFQTQGLKIYTTLDQTIQIAAQQSLVSNLAQWQERGLDDGLGPSSGRLQGAVYALNPQSGAVLAMVGGDRFENSQFNRAVYTKRQLGSLFLPIYVGLAIENGYQLTSRVNELPIAGGRQSNSAFPTIYEVFLNSNLEHGAILLASLGAGSVAKFAKNLGFDFDLDDLRLALGRGAASSQQVAVAFSAFANEGATVSPYLVWRIEEQNGTVLYQKQESSFVQIISPETSHIVTQGLTHVVNHGVGQGAKISGVEVAGFPGVSSDLQNGWFVGVGNEVVTAVWIGAELGKVKISHQDQDIINFVAKVWKDTFQSLPQLTKIIPPAAAKTNITYSRVYFEDNNPVTLPFLTGQEPQVIKF